MGIKNAICATATKLWTGIKVSSPTILVIGGTVGLVAAGVIACVETRKMLDGIIIEHKESVAELKDIRDGKKVREGIPTEVFKEKYYKKELFGTFKRTIGKLTKAYKWSLILGFISGACIIGGHKVLNGRYISAAAEAVVAKQALNDYRQRWAEKVGDEAERLVYLGGEPTLITDKEIDPETGEEKAVTKEAIVGPSVPLRWTYIVSKDTVVDALYGCSDGDFQRQLRGLIHVANQYFSRHEQISLHTIMTHWWKDEYLKDCPETIPNGWILNDEFIANGGDPEEAVKVDVKMINSDPDNRVYAVTFNVMCNIVDAMALEKARRKASKKPRKKVNASIRPALA